MDISKQALDLLERMSDRMTADELIEYGVLQSDYIADGMAIRDNTVADISTYTTDMNNIVGTSWGCATTDDLQIIANKFAKQAYDVFDLATNRSASLITQKQMNTLATMYTDYYLWERTMQMSETELRIKYEMYNMAQKSAVSLIMKEIELNRDVTALNGGNNNSGSFFLG